jgi:hypothetical protein
MAIDWECTDDFYARLDWRSMRIGPSFIKIGKAILYR